MMTHIDYTELVLFLGLSRCCNQFYKLDEVFVCRQGICWKGVNDDSNLDYKVESCHQIEIIETFQNANSDVTV